MTLQAGHLFGNYRLVRLLGEGGFGEVYLVENPLIKRLAAVKVLHTALAQDTEAVQRFLNEARAASAIRHANIIEILDAGATTEGAPYILMEFLQGVSLQKRLEDRGRLPLTEVLEIARQAGAALSAAHAAGIVHRDLKPENLFLVPDAEVPGGERVKVLDFGIAKVKQSNSLGGVVHTRTGMIMGSPAYMSPEQCKDSADVDLRSDIYSFGIMLYQMVSGMTPFLAETTAEMLVMHLTATPRPLRERFADVPAHFDAAILRALSRARDDRFASIAAFLSSLSNSAPVGEVVPAASRPLQSLDNRPVLRPGMTTLPSPNTTFSRTTGEMAAEKAGLPPTKAKTPRRLLGWTLGGFGVLGGALLLILLKPTGGGPTQPKEAASPSQPVAVETPKPAEPTPLAAMLPTTPDAGGDSRALAEAVPSTEQARSAPAPVVAKPRMRKSVPVPVPVPVPVLAKPEVTQPDQTVKPTPIKKSPNVAGF